MPDAAEPFNVLRLVLCTQPRSNPIALGGSARMRPTTQGQLRARGQMPGTDNPVELFSQPRFGIRQQFVH
jgi:hypothetical protein